MARVADFCLPYRNYAECKKTLNGIIRCVLLWTLFFISKDFAFAESKCSGQVYKVSKKNASIFVDTESTSSEIISLERGDRVCYVGEKEDFIIISGKYLSSSSKLRAIQGGVKDTDLNGLLYVKKDCVRAVNRHKNDPFPPLAILDNIALYVGAWRSGVVPDNGLVPYQAFLNLFENIVPKGLSLIHSEGGLPVDDTRTQSIGKQLRPQSGIDKDGK